MTKMQVALCAAAALARQQTRPQFLAFFIREGLFYVVDQNVGSPDETEAWAAEHVIGRYDRTPTDLVWLGTPMWAFSDPDEAFAFRMRWG